MKTINRNLGEISGCDLSTVEKLILRGGEIAEGRIWCNTDLVGYGSINKGFCGLATVQECEDELNLTYPPPTYDTACEVQDPYQ